MAIQAHPFLVSRNRSLDYRTVVAPSFLINEGISSVLARAAGGNLTLPGYAICREIQRTQLGDLTLIFHVIEANQKDIYPDKADEVLIDPFGREIVFIEGVVLKERPDKFVVTQELFDSIHERILNSYRSFWEDTNLFEASVVSVDHLDLNGNHQSGRILMLDEVEPFILRNKLNKQPATTEPKISDIVQPSVSKQLEMKDVLDFLRSLLSEKMTLLLLVGISGVVLLVLLIIKLSKLVFR
ncbi:hypothetical protein [Leptolyngbya sp. ST-U4]|uniref:hypothetical protein n=1 Tax=Leptolyngbya sp. ST-U4 TaxID=2933912 RepID=UPI003297AA72